MGVHPPQIGDPSVQPRIRRGFRSRRLHRRAVECRRHRHIRHHDFVRRKIGRLRILHHSAGSGPRTLGESCRPRIRHQVCRRRHARNLRRLRECNDWRSKHLGQRRRKNDSRRHRKRPCRGDPINHPGWNLRRKPAAEPARQRTPNGRSFGARRLRHRRDGTGESELPAHGRNRPGPDSRPARKGRNLRRRNPRQPGADHRPSGTQSIRERPRCRCES